MKGTDLCQPELSGPFSHPFPHDTRKSMGHKCMAFGLRWLD
jgi:hypothetical protein